MRQPILLAAAVMTIAGTTLLPAQDDPKAEADAAHFPPTPSRITLAEGDVFLFLGDSITHQSLYTQFLETHFLTRQPDAEIVFWNSGIGGDRAANALTRFEADVAARRPTHVSVLLGMNDAGYTAWKDAVFRTYEADMTRLIDRLTETGASISLLHPTIFDSRAARLKGEVSEPTASRYNAALAYFGEWSREIAIQRGLGFADLHGALNRFTGEMRREDPRFTCIPDAVHPDPNGHLVMAIAILEELFTTEGFVSVIRLDRSAQDGSVRSAMKGGKLTALNADEGGNGITFTVSTDRLPWVVPESASLAFEHLNAAERFNQETLQVTGLAAGDYELVIDNSVIGEWSDREFAEGIDLAGNPRTPAYRRARDLSYRNEERNAQWVVPWRNLWRDRKIREYELQQALTASPEQRETLAAAHAEWMETEFLPGEKEAAEATQSSWKELRTLAIEPRLWTYEIRPASRENQAAP